MKSYLIINNGIVEISRGWYIVRDSIEKLVIYLEKSVSIVRTHQFLLVSQIKSVILDK